MILAFSRGISSDLFMLSCLDSLVGVTKSELLWPCSAYTAAVANLVLEMPKVFVRRLAERGSSSAAP